MVNKQTFLTNIHLYTKYIFTSIDIRYVYGFIVFISLLVSGLTMMMQSKKIARNNADTLQYMIFRHESHSLTKSALIAKMQKEYKMYKSDLYKVMIGYKLIELLRDADVSNETAEMIKDLMEVEKIPEYLKDAMKLRNITIHKEGITSKKSHALYPLLQEALLSQDIAQGRVAYNMYDFIKTIDQYYVSPAMLRRINIMYATIK